MSMSSWDVSAVSNGDNGSFDPSMGFGANMNSVDFDPSRLQNNQTPNLQFQQQMQNGNFRHGSPAVQNQMFQTSSVVPSKRPHSDYSASPSQVSRSQTPQQSQGGAFPGYTAGVNGQQAPAQFHHLQQPNSSNASPSPVMQNQNFNQHGMGRVQTASPSPFPAGGPGFGQHGSPPHMDQTGQFDSQANGAHPNMQGGQQSPGPNPNQQNFSPTPGNPGMPMQGSPQQSFNPKNMTPEQQRMMYEQARLRQFPPNSAMIQQQRQQMNAMNQMNMMGGMNAMPPGAGHGGQGMNPQQQQAARAQQMQRMMMPNNPESFVRAVTQFMQSRGLQFNPTPQICGRGVHSVAIYSCVMKGGGSRRVSASNQWGRVAQSLGFQPPQLPQAATELGNYWQTNLFPYETTLLQNLYNQQRSGPGSQMPMGGRMPMENGHMQGSPPPNQSQQPPPQGSPASLQKRRQSSNDASSLSLPGSQNPNAYQANGIVATRDGQGQMPQSGFPPNAMYGPKLAKGHPPSGMPGSADGMSSAGPAHASFPTDVLRPEEIEPTSVPEEFKAKSRSWEQYDGIGGVLEDEGAGGQVLPPETFTNQAQYIAFLIERFGVNILDLTMRLKSGLPGEVRFALDFLSVSSVRREAPLPLAHCEDLVDSLLDLAEDAVDQLASNAEDMSENSPLACYEELIRASESEESALVDVHEPGSHAHKLENLAERLLCATSLLRTWSTAEQNIDPILADGSLAHFLTTAIRYLGTRHLLLRSSERTLDFMKDILVLLSNVSLLLEFANKDEALHIIQFLLAFAPDPLSYPLKGEVRFPQYKPSTHHYLPLAVDVLAKVLAHGDPNRGYLKAVYLADCTSDASQDMLTRSFGLAISVVPCELYRAGLRLQVKKAVKLEPDVKNEAKSQANIMAQAKAMAKARANSTSASDSTTSVQLRQLRFQSKLNSNIEDIFNDAHNSETTHSRKAIQLLGPGKHPSGKRTAKLPCLVSGLLAADILLSLVPNGRPEIIRSWIESADGLILRLQKFVISSRRPPGYEPALPGDDDDDDRPDSKGASGRPPSAKGLPSAKEDSSRTRSSTGNLLPMFGFLPGELPEEVYLDIPTADGDRPGSSAADGPKDGMEGSPRDVRMRQPIFEQDPVSQMELDALMRSTHILRRLVQRTSKATRLAAKPAVTTSIAEA